MSNIDERVVKMEFDNKAFEKDAGDTLSTLDKLKEALKFDSVKDSFQNITKAANKVDVSNIGDGVDTVKAKFSALQVAGYTAISNLTTSLMNFGKNIVGKTFGQIWSGGLNRSLNIEQAKFTIEGLGKDFVQLKEDINYAVSGTAYGFDEAAKAASMMAASGIAAGDDMKASLRGISGMAAMTGDSYANIADIFGNIAGKGKLSLQEVNRFATRGINVAAKLAEEFGTTEEAVREMTSKGEIDFKTFAMAMDSAFGEHATEANKTFTGIMTNIKATLSRIGESFIHPLIETNEKDVLLLESLEYKEKGIGKESVAFIDQINRSYESGVTTRTKLNNAIRESNKLQQFSSQQIKALIDNDKKAFITASKEIPELSNLSNSELKSIYASSQKEVEKILAKTPEYADMTREELQDILATGREQFIAQAREMDKYAGMSDKQLGEFYDRASGFQYNLVTVFQAFRRVLQSIEAAINNSSFLATFIDRFRSASEILSTFFNAVAASFSGGVLTISEEIEKIGKNGEIITETLEHTIEATQLWNSFAAAIGATEADITNFLDTMGAFKSIFDLIGEVITSVIHALVPATGIVGSFGSVILLATGTIGRFVTAISDIILASGLIRNFANVIHIVFGGIVSVIRFAVNTVVGIFTKITSNPIFDEIVQTFIIIGNSINALYYDLYAIGSRIVNTFIYPFTKLGASVDITGKVIDDVLVTIADALHMFNTALEGSLVWISTFVDQFVDMDKVLETGNKLAALFKNGLGLDKISKSNKNRSANVFGGIESGVTEAGGGIIGMIQFVASSITNIVKKIDYKKIGAIITKGFTFIADTLAFSIGVVVEVFNTIGKALASIDYAKIAKSFGDTIRKLIEAIGIVLIAVPSFIAGVFNEFVNIIANSNLKDVADKLGETLGNILVSGIRLLLKALPLILRIIIKAFRTLLDKLPGVLGEFGYEIEDAFQVNIISIFSWINKALKKVSLPDIFVVLNLGALLQFLIALRKVTKGIFGAAQLPKALSDFFTGIKLSFSKMVEAYAIKSYVITIGLLIGLLYLISFIPAEKFLDGLWKLTVIIGLFLGTVKLLQLILEAGDRTISMNKMFIQYIATINSFMLCLTVLVGAIALLSMVKNVWQGVGAVVVVLSAIAGWIYLFNKLKINPSKFAIFAAAMTQFSTGMVILSVAIAILSVLNIEKLIPSVIALGVMIGILVVAANFLRGNEAAIGAFAALGPMILMIAGSLALLSLFDPASLTMAVTAITLVIGVLVGLGAIAGSFGAISLGLDAIALAIAALGGSVLAIGAGIFLFVSAIQTLAWMGKDGSMQAFATSIQAVASCIPILFAAVGQGIVEMIKALSDGAVIIADALMNIITSILVRLLTLTDLFVTVGLQIIMKILLGLSMNMYMIATMGIMCVVQFINSVADNMDSIIQAGVNLVVGFINGMANAIETNGDKIRAAVAHLMGSIIVFVIDSIQALLEAIPGGSVIAKKLDPAKKVIKDFFGDGKIAKENEKGADKIAEAADKGGKKARKKNKTQVEGIVKDNKKAAKDSVNAFNGISDKIGEKFGDITEASDISQDLTKTGSKSGNAYKDSFGKIRGLKDAGSGMGKKVHSGAASQSMITSLTNGGKSVGDGYVNGIEAKWDDAYDAGYTLGKKAKQGEKDATKHSSPSKVFYEAGQFIGQGYVNGITSFFGKVYDTGHKLGLNSIDGISSSINQIADLVSNEIDATPTITPVLDLTNVKMGANAIGSMLNNHYALGIAGAMPNGSLASSKNITFNNKITVDGTEDPSKWADEFIQELEIQARTL